MSTTLWRSDDEGLHVTQAGDGDGRTRVEVTGRPGQVLIREPDDADQAADALRLWARNERAHRASR